MALVAGLVGEIGAEGVDVVGLVGALLLAEQASTARAEKTMAIAAVIINNVLEYHRSILLSNKSGRFSSWYFST